MHQYWLTLQCRMIAGVTRGMLVLGAPDRGPFVPAAVWPDGAGETSAMKDAVQTVLYDRHGVIRAPALAEAERARQVVAHPLLLDDRLVGVVAVEISSRPEPQQRAVQELLQWGSNWLELMLRQQQSSPSGALVSVVEVIATCLEQENFQTAATAAVTEIATRLDCERVSLGFLRNEHTEVLALSHSAQFAKNANLLRSIGLAMDEAIDQDAVLVYPSASERTPRVMRAHEALAKEGAGAICTVPLNRNEHVFGALTFERPAQQGFDPQRVELCGQLAALVGPLLELQYAREQPVWHRLADIFKDYESRLLGNGHATLKAGVVALLSLIVFFSFAHGDYRVTGKATLEGSVQRAVVAPQEGFIKTADARAGDLVKAGAVLATLEDQDLKLEQAKWLSQREQYRRESQGALANHDRSQYSILSAQIAQADAQLELLDEQLSRTQVTAPYDGVIVTGDLTQSLGSPVARGDVLYEIAPLNEYRVILRVDERDITEIAVGQQGRLALTGMPGERLDMVVTKVTPVANAEEGVNYFRVETMVDQPSSLMRPGMEGVGKIEVGERRLIWILTHRLFDWWRLWVWSWWP